MNYFVTWEINIEAATPREAAEQALTIQRQQGSCATVFRVCDSQGETVDIDLDAIADAEAEG
jgi:hypothetical protein